jgi:hypothetical protein
MKDKEYTKKLESAEAFLIQDPKKLTEKELKDFFGVVSFDKDLKRCIDETQNSWEDLEENYSKGKSFEKPLKPISLIVLLRLAIETPKKKKFDIYALGTKDRYSIMTNRF